MMAKFDLEHFVVLALGTKISGFNLLNFESRGSIHATVKTLDFS